MKKLRIFRSSLFALCFITLTSCAAFTKRDALDAGFMLAKASIDLAAQKAAGEKINVKEAAQQLGFQLVSQVSANVQANLQADNKPLAAATVAAAGEAAQLLITETPFDSPEARAIAFRVAREAVNAASEHLRGLPAASPSK